ncbi:MAG: S1C family serine protease, partial [Planctomycetota bacterium]
VVTIFPTSTIYAEKAGPSAWLGVQLTPVPAALSAHLGLKDAGLMISNVFTNSPADDAGIIRYDVIIEAYGKIVNNKVEDFVKHIHKRKPSERLKLTIIRLGKKINITVKLGEKPDHLDELDLKYEITDPDVAHWRKFGLRGKILRPDQKGGWKLEDLGEIPKSWITPEWKNRPLEYWYGLKEKINQAKRVDKQGRVLHVQQKKDGTIEVKRYKETDGEEQANVKTYNNMQELQKDDPEAHELLDSTNPIYAYKHLYNNYLKEWPFKQAMPPEEADRKWREWRDRFFQGPLGKMKERIDSLYINPQQEQPKITIEPSPEPEISFDVNPEGEISVRIQDKDASLNMTFHSKDAMKRYSPDLYKRFQDLEQKIRLKKP